MATLKGLVTAALVAGAFAATLAQAATTYVVGTGATYRPFEFETPNKELVGFDVDLMKEIAKHGGFEVKFINTPWSGIFESLETGDRDIVMSGITITDKRKQAVDFAAPYFLAHQLILTSKNVTIKSLKDLEGKPVAVVNASAGDIAASKVFGKTATNIRRFENTPLALEELNNGGVDAMIGDVGVLQYYSQQNPDKQFNQFRDPDFEEQYFGIAVKKGNKVVLDAINKGLAEAISSGDYNKVYQKWFGKDAPKLPQQ